MGCRLAVPVMRHHVLDHEYANRRDLLGKHQDGLGRGGDRLGLRVTVGPLGTVQLIEQLQCCCQVRAGRRCLGCHVSSLLLARQALVRRSLRPCLVVGLIRR